MKTKTTLAKNFIPAIHFYGLNNQFHRWLFGDKPYFFDQRYRWLAKDTVARHALGIYWRKQFVMKKAGRQLRSPPEWSQ